MHIVSLPEGNDFWDLDSWAKLATENPKRFKDASTTLRKNLLRLM